MALIKEREFNKEIGFYGLIALGVGATIGAGIFVLLGEAATMTGPSVVIAFVINFFLALVIAFHYAEMASLSPVQGGGYSFIEEAFGPSAYYVGWLIWLANIAYSSFCAIAFALYISEVVLLPVIPVAVGALLFFAAVNLSGISSVVDLEKLLTVLLVAIFVFFTLWGSQNFDLANLDPMFTHGYLAFLPATSLVFVCFIGFETITTISAEVKRPKTNIPKALIWSVIICGILYTSFSLVFVGVVNVETIENPETALLLFFQSDFMKMLLIVASIFATLSSLNIGLMAASRNAYALARDGFLPKRMSRLLKNDSPHYGVISSAIIGVILLASGTAKLVASISDFSYMIVVSMVCLSVFTLRKKDLGLGVKRFFKVPMFPFLSFVGIITPLVLVPFLETGALLVGLVWLILGFLFYTIWSSKVFKKELGGPKA